MINFVVKRDGSVTVFDQERIQNAICSAAQSVGIDNQDNQDVIHDLSKKVAKGLAAKYQQRNPTVEQIQDFVEKILIEEGHVQTSKAYILYRAQQAKLRAQELSHNPETSNFREGLGTLGYNSFGLKAVVKRDGSVVPFDISRIQNAIFAAAHSVGGHDHGISQELSMRIKEELAKRYAYDRPTVENVQDMVEKILIEKGHAKTAKAYILYRAKHSEIREQKKAELIKKIKEYQADISMPDGSQEKFDMKKMVSHLQDISEGLTKINIIDLANDAVSNLYKGISLHELERALINAARARIEKHPQYSLLASRLLQESLYKKILSTTSKRKEEFKRRYRLNFKEYIQCGINDKLLDSRLAEFDLDALGMSLLPDRDRHFHFRGIQTLSERYLMRRADYSMETFELPQYLWMRIAMGLCLLEPKKIREEIAIRFYSVMSEMLYIPSTPTLFNAGTRRPQLSSCFLNTVSDSLSDIFKSYSDNAKLSKYAGGLGTDWTQVRSMGTKIRGTNGKSQGIIPFLKIFNDVAIAVNQGGKRKGAMCAYLETWHGDLEEFLEAKKNTGDERRRLHDVHTALWIPDLFMKRVEEKKEWTLFSPSEVPDLHNLYGIAFEQKYVEYEKQSLRSAKTLEARSVWRKILTMLFETGHPWITFKDPCNVRNPQDHCGVIHNSNLCTEITLNNSDEETAVCNLGSLNLSKMISQGTINHQLLASTTQTAMRMLDNVIDVNYYPTPETKNSNMKHRPVGLGIMGYQDALYRMGMRFASEDHLEFADRIMEEISYNAILGSANLAKERGTYESYAGSKWSRGIFPYDTLAILEKERGMSIKYNVEKTLDWEKLKGIVASQGMRNSNCMAIAPTATISNIAGIHPCIEPAFRNIYVKENTDGSFIVVNENMVQDLEDIGIWNEDIIRRIKINDGSLKGIAAIPLNLQQKYEEVFEIDPEWILNAAARRAKWIDQSQSLNIFMSTTSGKVLDETYKKSWQLGLKTTYYLRTQSASQIEKTVNITQPTNEAISSVPIENMVRTCDINDPDCEVCQ